MFKTIRNRWKLIGVTAAITLGVFYAGSSFFIGRQVKDVVAKAQASELEDPVAALLAVVHSSETSLSEKNSAVWALGQLGRPQALAALEKMHSAKECDHSQDICQHELDKAIDLCRGRPNLGAWIWRHGELASP